MVETSVTGKVTENNPKERTGGSMPNMEAVRLAKDLIKEQFGTLNDVPKELTIIIANLYYKLTANLIEMMGFPTERKTLLPETVKRQIKEFGSMVGKFLSGEPQILAELKSVIENVKSLRKKGRESSLELTESNVELILQDLEKKRITQAMPGTQRP